MADCGKGNHILAYDRTDNGATVMKCQVPGCGHEETYRA